MAYLVHNERVKLRANALDRASTAIFTGGVVAPAGAVLFAEGQPNPWILLLAFVASVILARALHALADRILADLKEDPKP